MGRRGDGSAVVDSVAGSVVGCLLGFVVGSVTGDSEGFDVSVIVLESDWMPLVLRGWSSVWGSLFALATDSPASVSGVPLGMPSVVRILSLLGSGFSSTLLFAVSEILASIAVSSFGGIIFCSE